MDEQRVAFLRSALNEIGLSPSDLQISQLMTYYEFVVEKNKVMNLTAITEFEEFVQKHFVDSLSICKYVDLNQPLSLLDVGTGAGFPGIPLKIMFPELQITLLDSLQKRIRFLLDVIFELKLEDIEAIHGRAEELKSKGNYFEQFDYVVSRAVASLPTLAEYCIPYVKVNGYFIAYKANADEEIEQAGNALRILGGKIESVKEFELPDTDYHRSLVMIRKVKNTDSKYPRAGGKPVSKPL